MAIDAKRSYEFGTYRLIPAGRALLHGRKRLDLPPRVFDTLVALVGEKGQLVEKATLMQTVWPDTVVEENNLSQAVYLLRKVLHDGEDGIRYIETVPKQGYRFIARVREIEDLDDDRLDPLLPEGSAVEEPRPELNGHSGQGGAREVVEVPGEPAGFEGFKGAPKSRSFLWMFCGLLIGLLILGAVGIRKWRSVAKDRSDLEGIRSIAVLPLQNLSNDPEQEYFADGMTDELITELAQIRELRVVSKTSIMQYKGAHEPLTQIGRELGVDAVVEGSVLRAGNRVRITAQLIRTATDSHLWARSYEGEVKDVLSLQSLVAEAITGEVKLSLTAAEHERLHRPHPVNPKAYEAYLRGRFAWNRRDLEGFREGIQYFNQAIGEDSEFALAYSGLADCYTLMALDSLDRGSMVRAKSAAQKALLLDDGLAEAHTSLAAIKVFLDWDWTGAENEFQRALELNPNYAPAHHWYGNILLGPLGRHDEAMVELRRAQSLDPLSLIINTDIGYADFLAGHYEEAFAQYQRVLGMDHSFISVHSDLLRYYQQMGMGEEWVREETSEMPKRADAIRKLYVQGGFRRVMLERAVSKGTFGGGGPWQGSFCTASESYAFLGEKRMALAALEQCFQVHEPGLVYLKVNPAWNSLRAEPQFQSLEHRLGLQ